LSLLEVIGADPFRIAAGNAHATRLHRAEDHPLLLLIASDRALLVKYVRAVLEPLAGISAVRRVALEETLEAWLDAHAAAERLYVHPKTVQYRLAQLLERFGDRLDDPHGRLELDLALRLRALAAPNPLEEAKVR
jgi:DNA-binding PucR family transcriptional regulator